MTHSPLVQTRIHLSNSELLYPKELLVPPKIVNNQGWLKGYFETIGNLPVTEEDLNLNFGFKDVLTKQFVDELGNPLKSEPQIWSDYGLGSYGSVGYAIHRALDQKPDLMI